MKISILILVSLLSICAFIPEASAKHYKCKSRSAFGLSFNFAPAPNYVAYQYAAPVPAVVPAPAPVAVMPYAPVARVPVYYHYPQPVVVAPRPYGTSVYVGPQLSYSYWHY